MSEAMKQPTVVVLLPHEIAAVVNALRAMNAQAEDADFTSLLSLAMDVCEAAGVAFHHAVIAPDPDAVLMVLGAPLHIHDGSAK